MPRCQYCHAAIEFVKVEPAGNYMPCDVPPIYVATTRPPWIEPDVPSRICGYSPRTTARITGWALAPGEEIRAATENVRHERCLRPHWSTCPAAEAFRKAPPAAEPDARKTEESAAPLATEHRRPPPKPDPQGRLF